MELLEGVILELEVMSLVVGEIYCYVLKGLYMMLI